MGRSDEAVVRGWRARRPRALAAVVSVGLLSFAVLAPARADDELTPGSAAATASVAGLNIPYSGANIGLDLGLTNASFFEQDAKASAVSLEPAFLRLANVLKICGGGLPVEFTPATSADTNLDQGPSTGHREAVPGLGVEDAAAEPGSHSLAQVTAGAFGVPGLVDLRGGESESETRLDTPARTRLARAEVRAGTLSLAGGLIQMSGMRWTVEQQAVGLDGRSLDVTNSSEFSVGSITLAGLPLPAGSGAELASTIASINQVLSPFSLEVRLPVERPNGDRGIELTPLTIAIGGHPTFGPQLFALLAGPDATSVVNLFNSITQPALLDPSNCNSIFGLLKNAPEANALLNTLGVYGPIILSAVAAAFDGGAELNVNIGGARTTYDATYFAPRSTPSVATTVAAGPGPTSGGTAPVAALPDSLPDELAGSPVRTSTTCETTSPVGRPGCSKGLAPIAATAAALVTGSLFAVDELGRRRRLRTHTTEEVT